MLANCMDCGKLISAKGSVAICTECAQDRERNYQAVKDYLIKRPNARIDEVVEKTGIGFQSVREFWEDGRLKGEARGEVAGQKICKTCGTPISMGAYCSQCYVAQGPSDSDKTSGVDTETTAQQQKREALGFKKIESKEKSRMHTKGFGRNR